MESNYQLKNNILNNYCELYISSNLTPKGLERLILSEYNVKKDNFDLIIEGHEIYIDENEDFDIKKGTEFPKGFLYFKYILNFDSRESLIKCVSFVNRLLEWLWSNDIPAIASCDYEDRLVKNGGYKDSTIPFPKKRKRFWHS